MYKLTRVRLFSVLEGKAYLANIPLKNKPTITILHSITGNHNRLKIMYGFDIFTAKVDVKESVIIRV